MHVHAPISPMHRQRAPATIRATKRSTASPTTSSGAAKARVCAKDVPTDRISQPNSRGADSTAKRHRTDFRHRRCEERLLRQHGETWRATTQLDSKRPTPAHYRRILPPNTRLHSSLPSHSSITIQRHVRIDTAQHDHQRRRRQRFVRPFAPQEQQQVLPRTRRQLSKEHSRQRRNRKHHEQRTNQHHGAARVQQEVCGGGRWRLRQDVFVDQLQPGILPRGGCCRAGTIGMAN